MSAMKSTRNPPLFDRDHFDAPFSFINSSAVKQRSSMLTSTDQTFNSEKLTCNLGLERCMQKKFPKNTAD